MTARKHPADVIAESIRLFSRSEGAGRVGEIAISKLTAAGFSIVHESEIHGATREKCIEVVNRHDGVPCKPVEGWNEVEAIAYCCGQMDATSSITHALRALPDGGVDG